MEDCLKLFDELRILLKKNKITNLLYNIAKRLYYFLYIHFIAKRHFLYDYNKLSQLSIKGAVSTVLNLIYSDDSLGRFGDGELSWAINRNSGLDSFELPSKSLQKNLLRVLNSTNPKFMIGLPDQFLSINNLNKAAKDYWIRFIVKNYNLFISYLHKNKQYYNTNVTRPYIDFNNKKDSGLIFYLMKKVWKNKNVLIIEGMKSRIGVKDNLLDCAKNVKRIECPVKHSFEYYGRIYSLAISFLNKRTNYITLISLGPTATILSYDLCDHGFRAIDIGNLDIEYNWYLLGSQNKVNLPYKYVNEVVDGQNVLPAGSKYKNEIVYKITEPKG